MKVEIKQQLKTQSFRVKGVDVHPHKPLMVSSLFSGHIQLWNYESGQLVRSLAVSQKPVRAVRFIVRKNWIVTGGDDRQIRVYNASTMERVAAFEAHRDYIRYLAVHPTLPYVLSTGDDNVIHAWDWEKDWRCAQTFRGHVSYVLGLAINPKDPNQFASGSMDGDVKVWMLDSSTPSYTLEVNREATVNFVEYYPFADKPYLITAGDDKVARVIDYQSKQVVATLSGHTHNISFAIWHPQLPLIITGSEDNTLKLWNARSYKLEQTLNYGMQRAWSVCVKPSSNLVAFGLETGALVLRMGRDEPVVSMDKHGKMCWAKQLEAFSANVKAPASEDLSDATNAGDAESAGDAQLVHVHAKDLGAVEVQPTQLRHSADGKFVACAGDGDVIVYTALAWRNRYFAAGEDCCWGPEGLFGVLQADGSIAVLKDFKHKYSIAGYGARKVFGYGELLVAACDDCTLFFDWFTGAKVARIDVELRTAEWSEDSEFVALVTEEDGTYVLRVDMEQIEEGVEAGRSDLEGCFEEVWSYTREQITSLRWVGDCLVFTTASNRLSYLVGAETYNITHFDTDVYILRYVVRDSVVFLCDKELQVYAQPLSLALIDFQTAVLRGEAQEARYELLPKVPLSARNKAARFLEAQGLLDLALEATRDDGHKFDLALALGNLELASEIARPEEHAKWRRIGDIHLRNWNVDAATLAYTRANELDSLLLIHTSTGDKTALRELAKHATEAGKYNLAFSALWAVGDSKAVAELLNKSGRHSEAALFSWTYGVGLEESVKQWKAALVEQGREKIADIIDLPETTAAADADAADAAETTANAKSETKAEPQTEAKAETNTEIETKAETKTTKTKTTKTKKAAESKSSEKATAATEIADKVEKAEEKLAETVAEVKEAVTERVEAVADKIASD